VRALNPYNPIEHVVIIFKENHTFDNYFGTFAGANGITLPPALDPPAGGDPPHSHSAWLNRAGGAVREQYKESDIPAYFAYARQFTLCDNYFTEIASQSEPNYLMVITASSPVIDNSDPSRTYQPQPPFDLPSLPENLAKAGLTWKNYAFKTFNFFYHIKSLQGSPNLVAWTEFDKDVAAGNLPNVSWLFAPSGLDEHPPFGRNAGKPTVKPGMQWTVDRINQVAKSPLWSTTAIFLTWDDWGGWYDHVEPPFKDAWEGGGPKSGPTYHGTQFSYGPRVGCLVLSPYSKRGISKAFHSHVSIVRFCEKTFGLPPINDRDAAADDMSDCLDFEQTPLSPPLAPA
jgi:phospholipase C